MDQNALLSLAAGKVEEKVAPLREASERVRRALVAWEELEKGEIEREIASAIERALGVTEASEPDAAPSLALARTELEDAIAALPLPHKASEEIPVRAERRWATESAVAARGLEPVPGAGPEPGAGPGPAAGVEVMESPAVVTRETWAPTGEEWARAEELLKEIEVVDREARGMHVLRLTPLIQAIVAEIRLLSEPWSPSHPLHDRLTKKLGVLGAIRKTCGVTKYIEGLAFGSTGDWEKIARACRRRVEAFDRDAAVSPQPEASKPKERKVPSVEPLPTAKEWVEAPFSGPGVELPRLKALGLPVIVGGGLPLPEGRCEELGQKLGLRIEHHPIDHANQRAEQALIARVKGGKVAAVILVEGFMRHGAFSSIVKTCTARGVPYAYAGKGKTNAIEEACGEVERKLAVRRTAGRR